MLDSSIGSLNSYTQINKPRPDYEKGAREFELWMAEEDKKRFIYTPEPILNKRKLPLVRELKKPVKLGQLDIFSL